MPGYELAACVQASLSSPRTLVGVKGRCRFCGETAPGKFKAIAHTFPEALGNKWIISEDECDSCNQRFSVLEDSLVKAFGPILTVGGVLGKKNKVRQTGRSTGHSRLTHNRENGRRTLSFHAVVENPEKNLTVDPFSGRVRVRVPVPPTPFSPVLAYRALAKMGFSLLPERELASFDMLRSWLMSDDQARGRQLTVGLSFASVGNAPPLVSGALLRRTVDEPRAPKMIFIFTAGSVCAQINLLAGAEPLNSPTSQSVLRLHWRSIVSSGDSRGSLVFDYGEPAQIDWSSAANEPCPIESIIVDFDPATSEGRMSAVLRATAA